MSGPLLSFSGGAAEPELGTQSMTRERYRAWLQLLVDGTQNMIRVWGGGIYEADVFYDLCDGEG